MDLTRIIDHGTHPIRDPAWRAACRREFDSAGVLVLPGFVAPAALALIKAEGRARRDAVFAQSAAHNVYLAPPDPDFPANHPRNRQVTSSKGCLTDDRISAGSPLRRLYDAADFRDFLCHVLGETALFAYADPLSSINLHFAEKGQELGWHFDNSAFSITLMIQPPAAGGAFEYVPDLRNADAGDMGYDAVAAVLDGRMPVKTITAAPGTLVIFRGRNALHRVAPNLGDRTRILAVLAYNGEPGVSLSESARLTFYGRIA